MRPGVQKPHCTAPYLVKLLLTHSPSPQAYLVPVRPILSRNISSALISAGTVTRLSTPFNLNMMSTVADMDHHPLQYVLNELTPIPVGCTHIADRMNFIQSHRNSGFNRGIVERFALDGGLGLRCADWPRCHGPEGDAGILQGPSAAHRGETDGDRGDIEGGAGSKFEELADETVRPQRDIDGAEKFGAFALRPAWPDKEIG